MTNIAEILKDAPSGLKLYSLVHGKVTLKGVYIAQEYYPIDIIDNTKNDLETLTKDGKLYYDFEDAECILFPSKEHKSWDNWQDILFQCGDVVVSQNETPVGFQIFLCYENDDRGYLVYDVCGGKNYITPSYYRYATPEERERFFKELNTNGYTWNDNTKQMEKIEQRLTPKYKVEDYIIRNSGNLHTIAKVNEIVTHIGNTTHYRLFYFESSCMGDYSLNYVESNFRFATEQELIDAGIKEKPFTIDDLKPFDKVLVRDTNNKSWYCNLFSHFNKNASYGKYEGIYGNWMQCIPYNDETKHLLGTTDDCPNKYITW